MHKLPIVLSWVTFALAACGGKVVVFGHTLGEPKSSTVEQAKGPTSDHRPALANTANQAQPSAPSVDHMAVHAIELVLSADAGLQAAQDARFKTEGLLDAVTQELRTRKLLDDSPTAANGTAEIVVDFYSLEPASNAVLFGYIISDARLNGSIRIRKDSEVRSYAIEAQTKLSIPSKEPNDVSLDGLYRRFAVLAADRMAGVKTPSDVTSNQSHR